MRSAIRYLSGAAVAALLGVVCVTAGRLQRDVARAQQDAATENYARSEAAFDAAERFFKYASRVPGVGNAPVNTVRARRAALQYWQHQYDNLVPRQDDPVAAIPPDSVDLQMLVANGVYRVHQADAKDRASTVEALNAAINAYLTPLKNSTRRPDAAFNYEYLVRLREEIEKGRVKPGLTDSEAPSPFGRAAAPDRPKGGKGDFKVLVPLAPIELMKGLDDGATGRGTPGRGAPGKGVPIKRKG